MSHVDSEGRPDEKREVPPSFFGVPDGTADQRIANAPARILIGPDERDQLASADQGQYYCVSARHGTLVCRAGRPVYATLAEWQRIDSAVRGGVYIPTTGPSQAEPLFGSLPLMDRGGTPDIVGKLIELISFLEKAAAMLGDRITVLDKVAEKGADGLKDLGLLVSQRIHFVELLDRAAALIDPDAAGSALVTYEQRLDWLAKWREVVGR